MAGLAGYLIGERSRPTAPVVDEEPLGAAITAQGLRMSSPAGWKLDRREVSAGSVLAGLNLVAARPDGEQSARLLAWLSSDEVNAQLLPLGLIDPASMIEAKAATTVEFPNGQTALRYDGLRLRGRESPLRVYVAPTTKGVLTLACPGDHVPQPCDAVATSLSAVGADPLPADPDATVAEGLRAAFSRLQARTEEPAARLAQTTNQATIRTSAGQLGAAYRSAAESIDEIEALLGAATISFGGVASRIDAVGQTYDAVAAAARSGSRSEYADARNRLDEARKQLELMLGALRQQGYDVTVAR